MNMDSYDSEYDKAAMKRLSEVEVGVKSESLVGLRNVLQELVDECTSYGSPTLGLIDKANAVLAASESKAEAPCPHDRLDEEGYCRRCGVDMRSGKDLTPPFQSNLEQAAREIADLMTFRDADNSAVYERYRNAVQDQVLGILKRALTQEKK